MRITGSILTRFDDKTGERELLSSIFYFVNDHLIIVHAGFKSDFASVPSILRGLIDNDDPQIVYGAIIHDLLYSTAGKPDGVSPNAQIVYTRRQADQLLYDICIFRGMPKIKAFFVYSAVRTFGYFPWRKNT